MTLDQQFGQSSLSPTVLIHKLYTKRAMSYIPRKNLRRNPNLRKWGREQVEGTPKKLQVNRNTI